MKKILLIIILLFSMLSFSQTRIVGNFSICLPAFPNTTQLIGTPAPAPTTPWFSINPAVATIDNTGLVTAVSFGVTTIIYTDVFGNTASQNVYVSTFPTIVALDDNDFEICLGDSITLGGSLFPHPTIPWTSSNESIAIVNEVGEVRGVGAGVVNIIYTNIGGCSTYQSITINPITQTTVVCGEITDNSIMFHWTSTPNATYLGRYSINGGEVYEFYEMNPFHIISGLLPNDSVALDITPFNNDDSNCNEGGWVVCQTSSLSTKQNPISSELKIYPNPVADKLYLSTNTNKEIKIFDVIGHKIIDIKTNDYIDTSNLSKGLYFCEIIENNKKINKKFFKN